MRRDGGFNDLSPVRRAAAVVLLVISLGIVATAQRDIQYRSDAEVRGSKLLWRCLGLNAFGALAYFRWGIGRT